MGYCLVFVSFYDFTSLHIITGQIWANMKEYKKIFKIIDDVTFRNNDYLLVTVNHKLHFSKKINF